MNKIKEFPVKNGDVFVLLATIVSVYTTVRIGVFNGFNFGFSIGAGVILLVSSFYLFKKRAKNKVFNTIMVALLLVLISSFSVTQNGVMKFCTLVFLAVMVPLVLCSVAGNSAMENGSYRAGLVGLYRSFSSAFLDIDVIFDSYKQRFAGGKNKNIGYLGIGLLVSVPLVCIVVPLLSSSDIAFNSLLGNITSNIVLFVVALVLTLVASPIISSFLFSMKKKDISGAGRKISGKVPPVIFCTMLCAVSVVYIMYAISQLAYITKAFSFLLPEGFSAAEFARSGFFQMGAISFINFIIIGICTIFVKRKENGKLYNSIKGLVAFICIFTIFYISTAFLKMMKYISLYGLTQLRVLTSVFMMMLAIIFVIILLKLFISKLKYIKAVILVCTLTLVSVTVVDTNTIIAEYNYDHYKKGEIKIDVDQIGSLGLSGVPTLVKLADDKNEEISDLAKTYIIDITRDEISPEAFVDEFKGKELFMMKTSIFEKNYVHSIAEKEVMEFIQKNPDLSVDDMVDEYFEY